MTWPALDDSFLTAAAETYNFKLGLPVPVAVTPDGAVLFRRTGPREFSADLYEMDVKTGAVKTVVTAAELLGSGDEQLSDAEKARRERSRTATRGIVEVDVSGDGKLVLVPLGGKLYVIDRSGGPRRTIDPGGGFDDARISPDGATIAFVRDGDLYTIPVGPGGPAGGAAKRLTKHPEGFEYGLAEFAAQEELDRRRGYWWSPDSKQLLFQRTDLRPVETVYVADARHPEKPPVTFKYPRAGTPNAIVDLGVIEARGGEPQWLTWDLAKYPYLARVSWPAPAPGAAKPPLTIVVMSREQTDLAVLAPLAKLTLLEEHDDAWLNLGGSGYRSHFGITLGAPVWLPDASAFLWQTEAKGGAWTLELHKADGSFDRSLTTPEFGLGDLVGIADHAAIVEASPDPTRMDVWVVPLDGGASSRLTDGAGYASGAVQHDVVVITALHGHGGRSVTANGHELPSVAEQPALVATTKLEVVQVAGRDHHVAITRPRTFDPKRRYPVLVDVYGGPHKQMVLDALDTYVMDQWYADAGFIVVRSDGRGTPGRGRAWERAISGDLLTAPLDDQVGALQAIGARYPELDLARVGIFGWSFGGYLSALAVLLRPDVFACGIAGAPVTDWSLYDTAYTERYMRTPDHNPDGYKRTSALTHAAKLRRPLLLIHGITDDNVHLANTLGLIEDLYVAGKTVKVVLLSGTHMVPDPKLALAREQVQVDFFREHLGAR
ncbi:MAG: prolyl oligopeptidase family serine peptidase [Kofleriaceae bacterium]